VLLRTELLRGELDRDGYRDATLGLLRAVEKDPRLSPILAGIDRQRLLLAGSGSVVRCGRRDEQSAAAAG
jgi:hypothetical protein